MDASVNHMSWRSMYIRKQQESVCREVSNVICTDEVFGDEWNGPDLTGEGYNVGGLIRKQAAGKIFAWASDGATSMFGCNIGALKQLVQSMSPLAKNTWCFTHRAGLCGRDLETAHDVEIVKRLVVTIGSDMAGSAQRQQQRLQLVRSCLQKEIAILTTQAVRWLSLKAALDSILKQVGPLVLHYGDRVEKEKLEPKKKSEGSSAQGILNQLCDTRML